MSYVRNWVVSRPAGFGIRRIPRSGGDHAILTVYGIRNCDTVKKARVWLDAHGVAYRFHDYQTDGVDEAALDRWIAKLGWEALLNRAGTTFRKLSDADKADIDTVKARALMLAQPSMIRRPVAEDGDVLLAGFKPDTYLSSFTARKE